MRRCRQPVRRVRPVGRPRRIAWLTPLLAALACPLAAQERTGVIEGRVLDARGDRPVAGARVLVVSTGRETLTNADGRYRLVDVPVGVWTLEVRALGYLPRSRPDVSLGSGRALSVTIRLEPAPLAVEELRVETSFFRRDDQTRTSTVTLAGEEIRRTPGGFEDVVRSVSVLPGVGFAAGGRNDLVVRGGAPFENLFLIDGLAVPNINHFGSQGSTGGPISLLNIDVVEDVRFGSGGFGARYGDRTSSVTDITLRTGSESSTGGELSLSATGFGVAAEGPVGNGSFWLGIRRSYLDLIFKAAEFSFIPEYWDFAFKLDQRLGDSDRISVLGVGAIDDITFNDETDDDRFDNSRILGPELRQYFSGVRWERSLGASDLSVTLGRTFTSFESVQRDDSDPPRERFRNESREGENELRAEWVWSASPETTLRLGSVSRWASALDYDVRIDGDLRLDDTDQPRPFDRDTSFTAFRTGAYAELLFPVAGALAGEVGARVDHYGFLAERTRLSPRLGASLELDPRTRLNVRAGRYYQPPSYIWLVGDPGNPDRLVPIRSDHVVLGLSRRLRPDLRLQVEAYHKWYDAYPARIWRPQAVLAPVGFENASRDIPFGLEPLASEGTGRVYGVEAFLRKRLSGIPVFGLASFGWSRARFEGLDGVTRPGAYDTRVLATAFVGYRIGPSWEVSGKFRFASGRPETPFVTSGPTEGNLDFTRYNEDRLPAVHQLDIRVDRRWSWSGVQLELYLDIQNVYGRTNVTERYWDAREGMALFEDAITVLPTIGATLEF